PLGNKNGILYFGGEEVFIGGSEPSAGNVISGNTACGICANASPMPLPAGAKGMHVLGNLIGTDVTGTSAVPNTTAGIRIYATYDSIVGGALPGERNIISGNTGDGVLIEGYGNLSWMAHANVIAGNYIGLDVSGARALPN